jgi:high-affinity K+ transport system ATPase subunit B
VVTAKCPRVNGARSFTAAWAADEAGVDDDTGPVEDEAELHAVRAAAHAQARAIGSFLMTVGRGGAAPRVRRYASAVRS